MANNTENIGTKQDALEMSFWSEEDKYEALTYRREHINSFMTKYGTKINELLSAGELIIKPMDNIEYDEESKLNITWGNIPGSGCAELNDLRCTYFDFTAFPTKNVQRKQFWWDDEKTTYTYICDENGKKAYIKGKYLKIKGSMIVNQLNVVIKVDSYEIVPTQKNKMK